VRPLCVVNGEPVIGEQLHLLEGFEHVLIEYFVPIGAIESLDEGVLMGLARLDIQSGDPLALCRVASRNFVTRCLSNVVTRTMDWIRR